jgi:hypothetical protein
MHRVSAAALNAAREVLKHYQLVPRPEDIPGKVNGLLANAAHIAIIIDHATAVYKIALLRPEVFYWQTALRSRQVEPVQIEIFLKKVIDTFAETPQYGPQEQIPIVPWEYPVQWPNPPLQLPLTKASLEASRFLWHYYELKPIDHELLAEERLLLAKVVESGLGMDRVVPAAPLAQYYYEQVKAGRASPKEIRTCLRSLGVLLAHLPTYADLREETMLLT